MPSRGPRRAGPVPVWWRAAAATAAVSVAVSGVVSAQYEAFKKVTVGECPLCCPEGQVLAFQYTQGRVDELGSTSAARDVVTEPGLWKCDMPPSHLRALSASNSGSSTEDAKPRKARPRSKSPRFLGDTDGAAPAKEPAQEQQPENREETLQQKEAEKRAEEQLQKRVEEETVKQAERETEIAEEDERGGTRVDDIDQHFKPSLDDKCFQKFGTTYDACLPFIKREICQWNPYPDGSQKGWCITPGLHPPPQPRVSDMVFCLKAGIDCNERAGGRCFVRPQEGYYPPMPTCMYKFGASAGGGGMVISFDCRNLKSCQGHPSPGTPDSVKHAPKGYCHDDKAEEKLKEALMKIKKEKQDKATSPTHLRPPPPPPSKPASPSNCAKNAVDKNAARPKGAPAACASTLCSFEKNIFDLRANSTSLFCASVLAGKLSHREMERFCNNADIQNVQEDGGWGAGTSALACSQCTQYCEKESVSNVSRVFEASCNLDAAFSSVLCPSGTMYADGRCFWLDRGFRTRAQSRGVCRRAARDLFGVEDTSVASDGSSSGVSRRSQARTAILSTESMQCVSVGLFREIRGSAKTLGKAPWCGGNGRHSDGGLGSDRLIPYSYAVARGWIGMHVVPGQDGGPKWEDGSPFAWNNFVSNAAFGNSTLVLSSGSDNVASEGEMLDVFAAAGVESGIWYSVKRAKNTSREKPFRAYTICEFDASANWHERDVSQAHVPKQKQKCRKHQLLKVGLTLHRNMSRNAATNISGALATVMSAALGISSTALVHVPQCSNVDSTASVLGQWDPRGETRNGDGRRRMLSSAGTSVSVAYAIPSTVTTASVQAIDVSSVGEATTEQVYILSHDDQVVDAAPNVESISVEPPDPEASTDEKSGETVDTIMIVGVVGGVAVGLSLVGIVMMLNARKRKRRGVQERYNDCGSEHSNSGLSDCSDDPGIVTDQTNSPRSGSESEGDNARDSARSHARSGTPDTPTSDFARKVTKERKPEEFHDDNGAAERARSKQPKRSRFNGVATNTKTKSTAAPVIGAAVSSASLSSGSLRNSLNVSHSKNTLVEMTEISEEDVVTMMANEASWKSQGSAGSWDGSGGLIEPNMMNIFEEQLTLEAAMKQESSHADGVFDADIHGMNDDLDLMFGQIMQAAPIAPSLNSCAIEPVSTSFENAIANSIPVLPGAAITATDLGDSGDLPPGWQAALDPKSGMIYYANVITHESSWEKPTWEGLIPAMGIGGGGGGGGGAAAAAAAVEAERTANQKQGEGKKNDILQPDPRRRTSSADQRDREKALASRRKGKKWTPEEDAYIIKCVKETGASDWKKMGAPIMRTGAQCSQRWRKVLDPSVKRFVKWTPAEDAKLVQIYREHPNWTNKQVAELMPDRTPTQCHNRWNDKVNPSLRWGDWSPEEDKILWDKRQLGHSWSKIVKENPELMDRAHVAVKNRWHSLELARKRKKKNKAKGKGARKGK